LFAKLFDGVFAVGGVAEINEDGALTRKNKLYNVF
jgi:hypothetical protein